ncbi:phosphatase PAP2 family protein [Salipaludibacillus sp. HK11]|uniref:phosphatase PAP2 family protein n=1 Tax=Salipaludibacillus sp. HK11 TaxID=3394320 RepID=UPI0039FBCE1B
MLNETTILIELTQLQNPLLDMFASLLTFLGNEEFYFLIIPFFYWCVSKKIGFRLFYIFLLSVYVNSYLKIYFAIERPIGSDGVQSIFVSSAEVGSHYPYDSFPSGHAQGSATLWGYLATVIRNPLFPGFAIILIFLISVARLYSGLHWPNDIIIGLLLGALFVFIGVYLQEKVANLPDGIKWILIFLIPLILVIIFPEKEGIQYAGILVGAGIGYFTQEKFIGMEISRKVSRKAAAFVIGIFGTFGLQIGLKMIFPEMAIYDFVRYGLIGLWITFIAPFLFKKLGIYNHNTIHHFPLNHPIRF